MAKADGKTSKSPEELPLDDPRWIRVPDLHRTLAARLGDLLADKDMTEKFENGDLPCMRRRISHYAYPPGPERERVQEEFWGGHRVAHGLNGASVVNRGPSFATDRWYVYFGWLPRAAEIWPGVFASASSSSALTAPAVDARNRGGRPPTYSHLRLVTEALIYIAVNGKPDTLDGEGGLFEKLGLGLRPSDIPERTRLYEIFTPIWKRIEDEQKRIEDERNKFKKKPVQ